MSLRAFLIGVYGRISTGKLVFRNLYSLLGYKGIISALIYNLRLFDIVREHQQSMIRLKKMMSEKQKKLKTRNNTLNLQITILGWLVEVLGFVPTIVGVGILGHGNSIATMTLHTISMINYFIILPCSILVNSSDVKEYIIEHELYSRFLRIFGYES